MQSSEKLTSLQRTQILHLAKRAGTDVLHIYKHAHVSATVKLNKSPVTQADIASHNCLVAGLCIITPDIPVVSEESNTTTHNERMSWQTYWLVDPLDGTKEFINHNNEFTINLALIHNNTSVFGVIYAPALNTIYWGGVGVGAYKQIGDEQPVSIQVRTRPSNPASWTIMVSRSHPSHTLTQYLKPYKKAQCIAMGSSLKMCLVAEGVADLYPRLGPTCEWDTAAAQAVVEAAGGNVLAIDTNTSLRYNTKAHSVINAPFVVCSHPL